MRTGILGFFIAAVAACGLASPNVARAEADVAGVSAWARYADEYPEYHAQWMAALNGGTNAFLKQMAAPSPRIEDREKMISRSLRDVYLHAGLSPWLAFMEDKEAAARVVPGGKARFTIRVTFSTVMSDRDRTASITDFAIRPSMPHLLAEESKGWMPGRTKKGAPTIRGWIDQVVWIKVPADAEPGRLPFTAYALTYGSQGGSLENRQQKQSYAMLVVPAPDPTRANALCVWAYGSERGQWLARNKDAASRLKEVHRREMLWADELLVGFGETDALASLVKELRRHPRYEAAVLSRLEPVAAE